MSRRAATGVARRLVRRLLVTVPLALLAVAVGPAGPAGAHAYLSSSFPADGSSLARAPQSLQLRFSESVDLPATHIAVVGTGHRTIELTGLVLHRGDDTEEPSTVTAPLPPLARGVYRVTWETLSSDDLHRTAGTFAFGIDRVASRTPFAEPLPRPEEFFLRWALFGALSLALGGVVLSRLASGAGRLRRAAAGWASAAAATAPLLAIGLLAQQAGASRTSLGVALSGSYGERWLLREGGLLVLFVATVLTRRGAGRAATGLVVLGGSAACAGTALLGHAAALPGSGGTRVLADTGHLAAVASWTGTVLVAGLVAPRHRGELRSALRRFGRYALLCLAVAVVTGVYLSSGVVGSVDAALYTWYGRVLLVKVAVLLAVLAVAAANHRRVRSAGPLRRTLVAEGLLLALALAAAAFLTSGQPAREREFVATAGPAPSRLVDARVADLQERVQLGPNRPGPGVAVVDVYDTRRPAPAPVQSVLVRVLDRDGHGPAPTRAQLLPTHGRWSATVTVPADGRVGIEVTVQRPGLRDVRHVFAWTAGPDTTAARPARVSDRPIGGFLRSVAAVLLLGALAAAAVLGRRRRRAVAAPTVPEALDPVGTGEPVGAGR